MDYDERSDEEKMEEFGGVFDAQADDEEKDPLEEEEYSDEEEDFKEPDSL